MKNLLCLAVSLLFLHAPIAFAELDPQEKYDNFNGKKYNGCKFCINSELWQGRERGTYITEIVREIRSKRAHLKHRGWGGTDSDVGTDASRNRLYFRGSENVTGICFTPRVLKYDINTCPGNGSSAGAQARVVANFYDADNDIANDGENGLIYVWFGLRRWSDSGLKKHKFHVSGNASQCGDANCNTDAWSTYDGVNDPNLWFADVKASNNKKEMCVGWDRDTHELVFSYGNEERRVGVAHDLPAFAANVDNGTQNLNWKVLETRADVHNCTTRQQTGYVDADFDNVSIRRMP